MRERVRNEPLGTLPCDRSSRRFIKEREPKWDVVLKQLDTQIRPLLPSDQQKRLYATERAV